MAKSKSGGTRSYIKGRIGADVYSIGKDGKGKKQQVIRSLAETVSNPRTSAQMQGRMIMSTVMQAVAALSPIIDHSFDGIPTGQPCISEFIRRNYALIKADAAAHPSSGNSFGMVKYQEKGARGGAYVIADGQANVPSSINVTVDSEAPRFYIGGLTSGFTAGAFRAASGLGMDDYLTLVSIDSNGDGQYLRAKLSNTLADNVVITADNVASLFSFEGTIAPSVSFEATRVTVAMGFTVAPFSNGLIFSKKAASGYEHNTATMAVLTATYAAADALPTYPTGEERFLNGGEL